jgi:hypothetical protein
LEFFPRVIRNGVEIVTSVPEPRQTRESIKGIVGLIEPIIVMGATTEGAPVGRKAPERQDDAAVVAGTGSVHSGPSDRPWVTPCKRVLGMYLDPLDQDVEHGLMKTEWRALG